MAGYDYGPDSGGRTKVLTQQLFSKIYSCLKRYLIITRQIKLKKVVWPSFKMFPLSKIDVCVYTCILLIINALFPFQGVILKPIIYGNVAKYFGKKREEDGHTHQWTVYVRPYDNEDMSAYIKKINFKLHDSYANQNRVITKPPYEVTETGWGEFEIVIKIYFQDPNERPVSKVLLKINKFCSDF